MATQHRLAAVVFLQSAMLTMDAYSTLNSSPWTAENFGADPEKVASLRYYVWHAVAVSMFFAITATVIDRTAWPVIGAGLANLYLVWLYRRAADKGAVAGSTGWAKGA